MGLTGGKRGDGTERFLQKVHTAAGDLGAPIAEIFKPDFMRRHSSLPTFEALLDAGGFQVTTKAELAAISEPEMDAVVKKHTSFDSWAEMQRAADLEQMKRKLPSGND